ncbi:beta-N-acetylhexosaminidase [Thalassotalea sp. HSM 43]|uniref:family 20 glycosylhydrolase n=1 Tax=Thalassotalea sp. HSM 43 TaxID=2552945 RepID=UPI001081E65B|nr:family 20 glycosylhydrolase [Thalassotalea sp. HSM 43]QBY05411.1 beta-N-acetylhexosaminidase [Thalassotalea sp. HSM 43]
MMKNAFALSLLASSLLFGCSEPVSNVKIDKQAEVDKFADSAKIEFELVSNVPSDKCDSARTDGNCFHGRLHITPAADYAADDLHIYFSQINPVQSVASEHFTIEHINGDLHRLQTKADFNGLQAGQTYTIDYWVDFWTLSETDALPNYIAHLDGTEARVIVSTQTQIDAETGLERYPFVKSFADETTQFKRTKDDATQWATAERLYQRNEKLSASDHQLATALIPTPSQVIVSTGSIDLQQGIKLNVTGVDKTQLAMAIKRLQQLGISESDSGVELNLTLDASLAIANEGYQLKSSEQGIAIAASSIGGLFYGVQSIAGLVDVTKLTMPHVNIDDAPHYGFRGMMVDVARNFHSKQFVLDLIEQMAAYKLNKLHLHLGDDEGWRLEINDLPELTDIGSKRCFDLTEQRCLLPQLGAGVDPTSVVNGYYSREDYIEILQYADQHQIQVIPSLDMPGHSRSSIVAMKARYKRLMAEGDEQAAKQYLLHDENDTTVYSSIQYYNDNTINACMESSYAFVAKVMDEVKALHAEAGQPLTRYHIGADETAGAWVESPICQAFLANNDEGITKAEQLGGYFVERVAKILSERGIETAGWSDGMSHTRFEKMPSFAQANSWGLTYWQGHQVAHKLANNGWDLVVSSPDVTYFDFPYEADPKEHGYYWASRHSNTEKLFQFMPDNLPVHAEFWLDRQDLPYQTDDTLQKDEQGKVVSGPLKAGVRFAGIQGQLWSENTRNDDLAEYKIFPRLFALAERAWHSPEWAVAYDYNGATFDQNSGRFSAEKRQQRDQLWANFADTIANKELAKLELADIFYRLPTPGAKVVDGQLHMNSPYPGLTMQYRYNEQWQQWTAPVAIDSDVEVRLLSVNGDRAGRKLLVKVPKG